ncbi:MAG: hypothetical protein H6565_12175 [Lewinellaceae bacterium]|nr:hypothetical protein [Lewinellaceae bacterium]
MGRYSTGAYILDELKTLSISDLKRLGYLKPGCRGGKIRWTLQGETTGTVNIAVALWPTYGRIEFSYTWNHEQYYRYGLLITSVPTNPGIGQRWYFIYIQTGKRCSKLYLANGYFQHREGIPGAMYRSQVQSHYSRSVDKVWDAHDRLYRPYMKWHYRGKPTPRYLRALASRHAAMLTMPEIRQLLSK